MNSPQRYSVIAEIFGALKGAEVDFYARVVKDYEQKKQEENGDVW